MTRPRDSWVSATSISAMSCSQRSAARTASSSRYITMGRSLAPRGRGKWVLTISGRGVSNRYMARKAGTTEYAVLGMLALGPGSGYDLKKRIEGSVAHFWSESYGQIYPILARLASRRLVERRLERQRGKPDRFVYSITAEGRERLGAWLGEPAREQGFRSELLLKLFFGRYRPVEESIRHVQRFRERQLLLKR